MRNQIIVANAEEAQVGDVTFPVETSQLHNFIVSLLGKPQIIRKSFTGSFEIDWKNYLTYFK
jgi:sporulation protein YlmC with PRC-barrel domain